MRPSPRGRGSFSTFCHDEEAVTGPTTVVCAPESGTEYDDADDKEQVVAPAPPYNAGSE